MSDTTTSESASSAPSEQAGTASPVIENTSAAASSEPFAPPLTAEEIAYKQLEELIGKDPTASQLLAYVVEQNKRVADLTADVNQYRDAPTSPPADVGDTTQADRQKQLASFVTTAAQNGHFPSQGFVSANAWVKQLAST